jgi:hypothetical protein
MKKLIFLFIVLFSVGLTAQSNTTTFRIAYEFENLTVDATAGGVAFDEDKVTNPNNPVETAQLVTFSVSCSAGTTCNIRFTVDGTAPTTTIGMLLQYGQIVSIYQHNNIVAFRAIKEGATDAVLNVQYFR